MLTNEDLANRYGRITASCVSAFLGFHRYKSPSAMWDQHTGAVPFVTNDDIRLGEHLEPGLVAAVTERLGWKNDVSGVRMDYHYPCPTLVSSDLPWAAATPDVIHSDITQGGIQIKNQNPHMAKTYQGTPGTVGKSDNSLVPPYMLGQCMWEMLVFDAPVWKLVTYFGGRDLRIYRIWRDQKMLDQMVSKAHAFWKAHIDPKGPMMRPSDANWRPTVGAKQRPRRLRGMDLINQPTPRSGK